MTNFESMTQEQRYQAVKTRAGMTDMQIERCEYIGASIRNALETSPPTRRSYAALVCYVTRNAFPPFSMDWEDEPAPTDAEIGTVLEVMKAHGQANEWR